MKDYQDKEIYVGLSPDTGRPLYLFQPAIPLMLTFNEAKSYAPELQVGGHHGWRLPTPRELDMIFNQRAAIGGFDPSWTGREGLYWTSHEVQGTDAMVQRFSDGGSSFLYMRTPASVCYVRS